MLDGSLQTTIYVKKLNSSLLISSTETPYLWKMLIIQIFLDLLISVSSSLVYLYS